jgi:6-phosphogluconate dehydrogenase
MQWTWLQVDDGPCVMYIGNGGAGNYVKMVHNGIEYGDMQLISGGCEQMTACSAKQGFIQRAKC